MPSPYRKKSAQPTKVCKYFQQGRCCNKRCPYLHVKTDSVASVEEKGSAGILAAMLKLFFEKQKHAIYNEEAGLFNLSNLASYSELESIQKNLNFNSVLFCNTLCSCIRDTVVPSPSLYQFDSNNIKIIAPLTDGFRQNNLHENVLALSFANNDIKTMSFVEDLQNFPHLREVVFASNPVAMLPDYRNKLKKEIVTLCSIDGSPARAPPLALQWPKFYTFPAGSGENVGMNSFLVHTALQENLIQFVLSRIIQPLEKNGDVDAVSDVYARGAVFSVSFEEAVLSSSSIGSANLQRSVVRDIVALRLRQKEANHNLLHGAKSTLIASGRTQVCMTLQDVLYPKNFSVAHLIHPSIDVTVLDNVDENSGMALLREPFSIVALHGVISWIHEPSSSPCVIRRNFSRMLSVAMGEEGRWQVTNDIISLCACHTKDFDQPQLHDILYTPWEDIGLQRRLSLAFDVPEPVVASLATGLLGDIKRETELAEILGDLSSIPLAQYEYNAVLFNGDRVGSILLCRIQKVFGLQDVQQGVELIQTYGLNWERLKLALLSRDAGSSG